MHGKIMFALLLVLFTSFGCLSPNSSGVLVENGRLYIEDARFASNIKVISDACEKTDLGFLHAQVTLKNTNRVDYRCQYRFEWRGKNGMIQKNAFTPWRPAVMHGRETVTLDAVSTIPDTEDFVLKLRSMQ